MFQEPDLASSTLPSSDSPSPSGPAAAPTPGWLALADRYVAEAEAERLAQRKLARGQRLQLAARAGSCTLVCLTKRSLRMRNAIVLALTLASAATPALADVCAWNDQAVARQAAAMLKPGDTIQSFCPGCGDQVAKPMKVGSATAAAVAGNPTYHQVSINGEPVDLAYTYVRTAPNGPWTNLGALVNCSTDNDSPRTLRPDQVPGK